MIKTQRNQWQRTIRFMLAAYAVAGTPSLAFAQHNDDHESLLDLSLEELMNMEVTSASKTAQKLSQTAAAVFVITHDDIRRSGATSIPEALRMAPGIEVARIDSNKWAVTARGFNRRFANKLLVLMDGRTLYTPLFSGVFWEFQDTALEDIDRIEIIRGPGATLWGANAVNGIINIITKKSQDTHGGLASIVAGTEDRGLATLRYGGSLGEHADYRVFTKATDRGTQKNSSGADAHDDWRNERVGMRVDAQTTPRDTITLQGEAFDGTMGETLTYPTTTTPYSQTVNQDNTVSSYYGLSKWSRKLAENSQLNMQVYVDHAERENPSIFGHDERDIYDFDFSHVYHLSTQQEVVWGAGKRWTQDFVSGGLTITPSRIETSSQLFNVFAQDSITINDRGATLTVGTKFESGSDVSSSLQPNVRLALPLDTKQTVWSAISKAERTPSRAEQSFRINSQTLPPGSANNATAWPVLVTLNGNSAVEGEDMIAYELGYRMSYSADWSLDVATYFNRYHDLRTFERSTSYCAATGLAPPCVDGDYILQLRNMANKAHGYSRGIELNSDWRVQRNWFLRATYTYTDIHITVNDDSTDTLAKAFEGRSPTNRVALMSSFDFAHHTELDLWVLYVDDLPADSIPSYTSANARFAWWPQKSLEIALIGQNLFDPQHKEFAADVINTTATEVERSVSAKATWHF